MFWFRGCFTSILPITGTEGTAFKNLTVGRQKRKINVFKTLKQHENRDRCKIQCGDVLIYYSFIKNFRSESSKYELLNFAASSDSSIKLPKAEQHDKVL